MHLLYLVAEFSVFYATAWCIVVPQKRASVCNGHAEFCDRSYGDITYIGAHNSFGYSNEILQIARNQQVDLYTQLHLGVRLLQGAVHEKDGELHFCHTSCVLFDGGTVQNYLAIVEIFMAQNPQEVLTLLFTNPDGLSLPDQWDPVFASSGIKDMAYVPPALPMKRTDWPTLGSMIDSGKRVVVFMDYGAEGNILDYILPEFDMIWETPYSVLDPSFPCSVDRITGPLSVTDHMNLINHSLNTDLFAVGGLVIVPDLKDAPTTNGVTSIIDNANGCAPVGGNRLPNFILIDWVNIGDAFTAAYKLNSIPRG